MNEAFILTGGNIGDRKKNLISAAANIQKMAGIVLKKSSLYETAAWGKTNQSPFLNQVLKVSTQLTGEELLATLLLIEQQQGRQRFEKMGPRTIDLDILFYNNNIINLPHLIVPHPQIAFRRFVLTPVNEIAPDFVHPVLQKSISQLLVECTDNLQVKVFEE